MSRESEIDALDRVLKCHQDCAEADRQLHAAMRVASDTSGPPPIAQLRSDYEAQRELTRAVFAYVADCGPDGPDVDGLVGSAFVLALFQAGSANGAQRELAELDTAMEGWWPALETTFFTSPGPPPRPHSDALNRIIGAADNWVECIEEHEHDQWAAAFAARGAKVSRTFSQDASVIHAEFRPPADPDACRPEEVGTVRRDGSLSTHLGRWFRPAFRAQTKTSRGEATVLSTHWTAGGAWRSAHKARTTIAPNSWIELWEWTFHGDKLVDVLPWLDSEHLTDEGFALVMGVLSSGDPRPDGSVTQTIGAIGAVNPASRGWMILVRDKGTDIFRAPRLRECGYPTLVEAEAAVQAIFDRQTDPE